MTTNKQLVYPSHFGGRASSSSPNDTKEIRATVRRVLSVMQRRRTMTTPLRMLENRIISPASDIPATSIIIGELAYVGQTAKDLPSSARR